MQLQKIVITSDDNNNKVWKCSNYLDSWVRNKTKCMVYAKDTRLNPQNVDKSTRK